MKRIWEIPADFLRRTVTWGELFCLACFVLVVSMAGNASADLVAHWRFDEGSGTVAIDSSGNGNDGTLKGDPQWVAGMYGAALEFDSDDYVDCGNDAIEHRLRHSRPCPESGERASAAARAEYHRPAPRAPSRRRLR